jgi:Na+/pantothenate symporter
MAKNTVRVALAATAVVTVVGVCVGLVLSYGPPDWARSQRLHDFGALVDIVAVLFWMLVFGIYWAGKEIGGDSSDSMDDAVAAHVVSPKA